MSLTGIFILFKAKNSFPVRKLLTLLSSAIGMLYFSEMEVKVSPAILDEYKFEKNLLPKRST